MTYEEVLEMFSATTQEEVKRNLCKYTECGAFIEFEKNGFTIGSIVEGSDNGTSLYQFEYGKFSKEELESVIQDIEKEANLIWEWANTARENGLTDAENGLDFPTL